MTTETATLEPATEDDLIIRAQQALSQCNWVIGECAAEWTTRYAKGRTDADFGILIGLSGDQVYQRRRVWQTFSDVSENYSELKWSHFYVALNWDDAADCLQWANDMEATVAEMKAWRRAQHGEDLSEPETEDAPFAAAPEFLTPETGMVRMPGDGSATGESAEGRGSDGSMSREAQLAAASANRESEYAPFGKGARGPAPGEGESSQRDEPSAEQVFKRAASSVERVVASLTPAILEEFHDLPGELQQRFLDAVENLEARTAGLS